MAPKLYMTKISPVVRAVLMCASAIDLELELIEVDLVKGEQFKPEFLKMNPVHTVPTLDDNGYILCDSHAIMAYLVGKYAKDKSLYPADVEKRGLIDQRLHFESGILFARHIRIAKPIILDGRKTIPKDLSADVQEAFGFLEIFLKEHDYVAGDSLSIADFSLINTVANASVLVPLDEGKHPNITAWRKRLETLPFYEINREGNAMFRAVIENCLAK